MNDKFYRNESITAGNWQFHHSLPHQLTRLEFRHGRRSNRRDAPLPITRYTDQELSNFPIPGRLRHQVKRPLIFSSNHLGKNMLKENILFTFNNFTNNLSLMTYGNDWTFLSIQLARWDGSKIRRLRC